MKSSHTPGPWEWNECGTENAVVYIGHNTIGGVYKGGDEDILLPANARLISAAPELLEACKELLAQQVCPLGQSKADRWSLACDKARAAITKAEGK